MYVKYSMDDANKLISIYISFVNLVRRVQNEVIAIPIEDCIAENDIPMTIGSLVALTFGKWIYSQGSNKKVIDFAMRNLGVFDISDKLYAFYRKCYNHSIQKYKTVSDLCSAMSELECNSENKDKLLHSFL